MTQPELLRVHACWPVAQQQLALQCLAAVRVRALPLPSWLCVCAWPYGSLLVRTQWARAQVQPQALLLLLLLLLPSLPHASLSRVVEVVLLPLLLLLLLLPSLPHASLTLVVQGPLAEVVELPLPLLPLLQHPS